MSWRTVAQADIPAEPFAADFADDVWVLRGLTNLFGFREATRAVEWKLEFAPGTTGFYLLARAAGLVVAVEAGVKPGHAQVHGVDPASGRQVWQRTLPLKPTQQGFAALDGHVYLLGTTPKGARVIRLNAKDGEVAEELEAPNTTALCAAGGRIFASGGGVPLWSHTPGESGFVRVLDGNFRGLVTSGEQLYCVGVDAANAEMVTWLDARAAQSRGSFVLGLGKGVLRIAPLDGAGRVVVGATGSSELMLVDLGEGQARWSRALDIAPHIVLRTPHGIVAELSKTGKGVRLAAFDEASGDEQAAPGAITGLRALFWTGARVVVASSYDLQSYAWQP